MDSTTDDTLCENKNHPSESLQGGTIPGRSPVGLPAPSEASEAPGHSLAPGKTRPARTHQAGVARLLWHMLLKVCSTGQKLQQTARRENEIRGYKSWAANTQVGGIPASSRCISAH